MQHFSESAVSQLIIMVNMVIMNIVFLLRYSNAFVLARGFDEIDVVVCFFRSFLYYGINKRRCMTYACGHPV